jgi:hypothetical protein
VRCSSSDVRFTGEDPTFNPPGFAPATKDLGMQMAFLVETSLANNIAHKKFDPDK